MAKTTDIERRLTSPRGGLMLGLIGLAMGVAAWDTNRRERAHTAARRIADAGRIPDLRLYSYGSKSRAPFRETLGAEALDLRLYALRSQNE